MESGRRFSRLEGAGRQKLRLLRGLRCCALGLWEVLPPPHAQWGVLGGLCQACSNVPPHSDSVLPSGLGQGSSTEPVASPAPGPSQGPLSVQNPMAGAQAPLCWAMGQPEVGRGASSSGGHRTWRLGPPGAQVGADGRMSWGCLRGLHPVPTAFSERPLRPLLLLRPILRGPGQNPAAGPRPAKPVTGAASGLTSGSAGQRWQRGAADASHLSLCRPAGSRLPTPDRARCLRVLAAP